MFPEFRIDVLCDDQMRASNMPFDGNLGDGHIGGDLRVAVTESVRKVDLSRPPADGAVHQGATISELSRLAGVSRNAVIDIAQRFSPSCAANKGAPQIRPDNGPCAPEGQTNPYFRTSFRS
jgi:hypothetical protein